MNDQEKSLAKYTFFLLGVWVFGWKVAGLAVLGRLTADVYRAWNEGGK